MENSEEILDIVDNQDNVIGVLPRSLVYQKNIKNFRVINAFILNAKGELWIPRRTANKRLCPLALDVSVGGHVESGETYDQAFARELEEELNLNINSIQYTQIGYITPYSHDVTAFMKIYQINMDQAPDYNSNDFLEYYWLTPYNLLKRIESGDKGKSDLVKLINYFFIKSDTVKHAQGKL